MARGGDVLSCADVTPYTIIAPGDAPGRKVVDLTGMGFPEIPALGVRRSARIDVGSEFHRHRNGFEVTLCARGCVKFDCEDTVHTLLPGMMFVARSCDKHRIRSNPKGACRYTIFLRFPVDRERARVKKRTSFGTTKGKDAVQREIADETGRTFLGLPSDEANWLFERLSSFPRASFMGTDEIRRLFVRLLDIANTGDGTTEWRMKVRTTALSLVLAIAEAGNAKVNSESDSSIHALIARMRRNPEENFTVEALVNELHLSANTVLNRFRRLTGLPPHAFLLKCRIRRACMLLRRTDKSVTEVAMELKFSSSQHFATRFKQEVGMPPNEWRVQKNANT